MEPYLRNQSEIFNLVYLISIQPKYRNGPIDPMQKGDTQTASFH